MQPRVKALFFDMQHAALGITAFVDGKTLDDLTNDLLLRSAVERQFEIIGEAMTRLRKLAPDIAAEFSEYQGIDTNITWRIIHEKLPILLKELEDKLKA
jgi:uncharacterized protein with HEPN domain